MFPCEGLGACLDSKCRSRSSGRRSESRWRCAARCLVPGLGGPRPCSSARSPGTIVDMSMVTAESVSLRAAIAAQRAALDDILRRYGAVNPRLFGSVARGDATSESDIDLLVDLLPGGGNELLCVAGIAEELSHVLGLRVDVVTPSLLRGEVSASALGDSVAL